MTAQLQRRLLRADGTRCELPVPLDVANIARLIDAECPTTVTLHHLGHPLHVLVIDDMGYDKNLPINREATLLYWANCRPGTTHCILGDAVVAPDFDFAQDDARWPADSHEGPAPCSTATTPRT